jgi:hypothetical protein
MATQYRDTYPSPTSQYTDRPKRPATYNGKSNWQNYLIHFELTAEINRWDSAAKAMELATSLRDAAQCVLTDFESPQQRNYKMLCELESRFGSRQQTELYRDS